MTGLEKQPLEFKDFSGGLTDNFLQGNTARYAVADNFLITVDHKLEVRPGTQPYDPTAYQPDNSPTRIAGLFTAINETVLFAHVNRRIYTQTPSGGYGAAWSQIAGPTGNEALSDGGPWSQVTHAEFQRQIFLTSDFGVTPAKIFRDQNNAWKVLTPGMPRVAFTPNYPTDASLLAACITLANAIRTSFVSHFGDSANIGFGTSTVNQHKIVDKWSLCYLVAQTFVNGVDPEYPGPLPAPTPAPAATDATSLYALCLALSLAFEHHRIDAAGNLSAVPGTVGLRQYHQDTTMPYDGSTIPNRYGINTRLSYSGTITTPQKAAKFLDDLWTKWYWHQMSPYMHSPDNTVSLMNKYLVATPKIGTVYSDTITVQVQPNYTDFISLAWWCKQFLNRHALGTDATVGNMHSQQDTTSQITLPDPTDFDSAALTIWWARWQYGTTHIVDAGDQNHTRVTMDFTAGSPSVTNVKTTATGAALTLPVGAWLYFPAGTFTDAVTTNRKAAYVSNSALGTATLSKTAISTSAGVVGQYSGFSHFHGGFTNGSFVDTTAQIQPAAERLQNFGDIGTDLTTWINLASEFVLALGAHENNGQPHKQANPMTNESFINGSPNGNTFFIPQVVTYAYGALYRYSYTVEPNGLSYLDQGTPIFSGSIQTCPSFPVGVQVPIPNTTYWAGYNVTFQQQNACATVQGIPALANVALTNFDTVNSVVPYPTDPSQTGWYSNLTIELFRTVNGGSTFYSLDSLTNTNASYSDETNESSPAPGTTQLNDRKTLYTSGGVVANDVPPQCKYIHSFNGYMYYGAIIDNGQYFPQRIRQSIQNQPDSSPLTFFDDLEDELTGLSSTRSNLLAFCRNSVYRCSGFFTSAGQGAMTHDRISDQIGCFNAKSIVKTEIGVFYAGTDGFYYTDGYQVIKISLELDSTYQKHTATDEQKARIYGGYDKLTRRIWWAMQSQAHASDNDVFFIFYLNYGVKPSGVFTKALTASSWKPSSHVFFKGRQIIGDSRGYLFKSDAYTKTDPRVDTTTSAANWRTAYIPYNWTSCALDFGTTFKRKWVTKVHATGQNVGQAAIQINSINGAGSNPDGSSSTLPLSPIQYTKNIMWGMPGTVWGDATVAWKYDGMMDLWRRFPSRSMRSDFKQVQYVPGSFVVYRSDDFPQFAFANVNKGALTATLVTPTGFTSLLWPLDVVDYSISFDTDGYVTKYLVTALDVTKKIITFTDPSGTVVTNATAKWQISGVKKEQRVRITALDLHFAFLGSENEPYQGASSADGEGDNQ